MAISCPKCGSALVMLDDDRAQCSNCNGRYRVRRPGSEQAAPPAAPGAGGNPYTQPVAPAVAPPPPPPPPPPPLASAPVGTYPGVPTSPISLGVFCANHPGVPAFSRCRECGKSVCSTCDFAFPGGVHLCPACATSTSKKLSPKRKKLVGWAYAMAIWCTLALILLLSGAFATTVSSRSEMEVINMVIGLVVFVPALVGGAVGLGSLDKRLGNPPVVIVAAVWNGILLALMVILTFVGLAMS